MPPKLSSRKFLLSLASLACATGLCALGHISDGVYSTIVVATVGAYLAANVAHRRVPA